MAAPFEAAFQAQQAKQASPLMAIHYRTDEAIFIQALPDRVTVIFSTEFKEETDKIYGKVFLQVYLIYKGKHCLLPEKTTKNPRKIIFSFHIFYFNFLLYTRLLSYDEH